MGRRSGRPRHKIIFLYEQQVATWSWRSFLKHGQQQASSVCNNAYTREHGPSSKECTTGVNKQTNKKGKRAYLHFNLRCFSAQPRGNCFFSLTVTTLEWPTTSITKAETVLMKPGDDARRQPSLASIITLHQTGGMCLLRWHNQLEV